MVVNRAGLWVLLAICCLPSLGSVLRLRLQAQRAEYGNWREAPLSFAGACVDGVLTGLGIGMSVALAAFVAAGVWVRVTS